MGQKNRDNKRRKGIMTPVRLKTVITDPTDQWPSKLDFTSLLVSDTKFKEYTLSDIYAEKNYRK